MKFENIVGQTKVKAQLGIIINNALINDEVMKPILLLGESGYGKSTIAKVISNEIGSNLLTINAASIDDTNNIIAVLFSVKEQDVVFIDEIHRLNKKNQELLYSVIDHSTIDLYSSNRWKRVIIPKINLIGATTEEYLLLPPLHNRFVYKIYLEQYSINDIMEIADKFLCDQGIISDPKALLVLAKASKLCPRQIINICNWVVQYCNNKLIEALTENGAKECIQLMGINEVGLSKLEVKYLEALNNQFDPISLKSLASKLGVDSKTITEKIEPYFIKHNIISINSKGRYLND